MVSALVTAVSATALVVALHGPGRGAHRPALRRSRRAVCQEEAAELVDEVVMEELGGEELGGACLNEEMCITVSYSSGPKGRQSRVRRTRRPPMDELWETSLDASSVEDELGYRRMSAVRNFANFDCEAAVGAMERDQSFRAFGERRGGKSRPAHRDRKCLAVHPPGG